jgi:hypothetical protein
MLLEMLRNNPWLSLGSVWALVALTSFIWGRIAEKRRSSERVNEEIGLLGFLLFTLLPIWNFARYGDAEMQRRLNMSLEHFLVVVGILLVITGLNRHKKHFNTLLLFLLGMLSGAMSTFWILSHINSWVCIAALMTFIAVVWFGFILGVKFQEHRNLKR